MACGASVDVLSMQLPQVKSDKACNLCIAYNSVQWPCV